jgi:hypothetical protein
VLPVATPVTTPVPEPTVATAVLLLVHLPPLMVLLSVPVAPAHTDDGPVIAESALTEIAVLTTQPEAVV